MGVLRQLQYKESFFFVGVGGAKYSSAPGAVQPLKRDWPQLTRNFFLLLFI